MIARWTAFNIVGAVGVVVQLGALSLLIHVCHLHYLLSATLAVEAAILHNFYWHHRWTWKDRPADPRHDRLSRLARFQALNGAISLGGNLSLMAILTGTLHMNPIAANVAAILTCAILNFVASDALVFTATKLSVADRRGSH